jgi:hypothetical protein
MDFIDLYEAEQRNLSNHFKWGKGVEGRDGGGDLANVQYKPTWNCHNESSHTMNVSNKKYAP